MATIVALEGGKKEYRIEDALLPEERLRGAVKPSGDWDEADRQTKEASAASAAAYFDGVNKRVQASVKCALDAVEKRLSNEDVLAEELQAERIRTGNMRYFKTPTRGDGQHVLPWAEMGFVVKNLILLIAAIAIAVAAYAVYVQASGLSFHLTRDWRLAAMMGFPVVLAGVALSTWVDLTDHLDKKKRRTAILTWSGLAVFLLFSLFSAYIFGPNFGVGSTNTGNSDGLQVANLGTATITQTPVSWISWLPDGFTGKAMFFTHLIAECLLSGGVFSWIKLQMLKGRQSIPVEDSESKLNQGLYDEKTGRSNVLVQEARILKGVLAEIEGKREAAILDATNRAEKLLMRVRANMLTAAVETLEGPSTAYKAG